MRCSLESKALLVFFWVILKIFWVNWRLNWQSLALIWSQDWHSRGQRDWSATLLNLSDQGHDRVPGIWMESEFGLNPLMVYWWMTKFESAKYRTFVDTYIWLTNIEHCAQSVRNVRVCCLVVRTRVCQMFPFTSYNPLGQSQKYSVSHHFHLQPTWSYSITKNDHFSIFSLSSLSDVSIHHLQPTWSSSITKKMFNPSSSPPTTQLVILNHKECLGSRL